MPSDPSLSRGPDLLMAVTGLPGEGKTHLLLQLAAHQFSLNQRVEGFAAVAGARQRAGEGAQEYRLRFLAGGEELPWVVRDETICPPYRFDPSTGTRLQQWAGSLAPRAPLVVLDEFSKFESQGAGLMPLWPAVAAAAPRIAVLAVRSDLLSAIEQRLGRRFDLVVPATAPDALTRLEQACADYGEWTRIGLFGGAAGGVEMTVGSALHAAKVPLRGLALSSLQGALMTFAGFGLTQPARVIWVPFISAGLKALSPSGNRLRPMLAISVQGALYGASVAIAGWNIVGVTLGGALIGAWAATQGFILQYLLLGGELAKAYDSVVLWLAAQWHLNAPSLPWLVAAWAVLHALGAGGVTLTAWIKRAPPKALRDLIAQEGGPAAKVAQPVQSRWRRIARDFSRWQFWLPVVLVALTMMAAGRSAEAIAWLVVRFVAVAFILVALLSLFKPVRWAGQLRRLGWWGPALALGAAIERRTPRN